MLAPTSSKTRISSKAVVGIIIGVVAVATIGGAIFYFRGIMPGQPEQKEIKIETPIDLSELDSSLSDPYLRYESLGKEEAGLRLSSSALIDQIDQITNDTSKNPYQNPQTFISQDVCGKMKTLISKIYFADKRPLSAGCPGAGQKNCKGRLQLRLPSEIIAAIALSP